MIFNFKVSRSSFGQFEGGAMFTCIGSMKAWDLRQCRSFHYNHHPYTSTTEETEKGKISPKENYRVLEKRILRIQFKLNTALLSYCPCVRVFVTGVTSHISHIYKGINAMLIIRDPSTPIYSESKSSWLSF